MAMAIAIGALLFPLGPAAAKEDKLGSVLDVLSSVLSNEQRMRGHIVHVRDATLIVRADDGQTYMVDATAVEATTRASMTPGQPVTIVAKPGSKPYVLVASEVRRDDRAQAARSFKKLHGVVQAANASTVTVRTDEGRLLSLDAAQIKGQQPQVKSGDSTTVVYEEGAQRKLVARWFEPDQSRTAAAPADAGEPVSFHGYVVNVADTALVVRADDGWTHVVDLSQLSADARRFELGEGVTISAAASDKLLTASAIRHDKTDPAQKGQAASKRFQTMHGTVQSISGSTLSFRTDAGQLMPVDVSQIKGNVPKPKVNEPITLVYEPGARGKLTAVWMQPDATQPSAAVGSAARERLRGQVDSVDGSKFWLRTDDDRWFLVDAAQVDSASRVNLRAGRQVVVVGKLTDAKSNQLMADRIRLLD
jgi:preprotein translocase subunit YajC